MSQARFWDLLQSGHLSCIMGLSFLVVISVGILKARFILVRIGRHQALYGDQD